MLNPSDPPYNAPTDGVTDATVALQAFLNDAPGQYSVIDRPYRSGGLTIKAGTSLVGIGNAEIKALDSLPPNRPLIINEAISGPVNQYLDTDISFEGIVFDGAGGADRSVELISMLKVRDVRFRRCTTRNARYIGLAIGGCKDVDVDDSLFEGCGKTAVTPEGGPCLWVAQSGDGSISQSVNIRDNRFRDSEWAGIYTYAQGSTIRHNEFEDVKEAAIFGGPVETLINDNRIKRVARKNISASGLELGGYNNEITGNFINWTDASSIALTDAQATLLGGNILTNPRRDPTTFPTGGGVTLITTNAAPFQPQNITVVGNSVSSPAGAIWSAFEVGGPGAAVTACFVHGNNFAGPAYASGQAVVLNPGKWASNSFAGGNLGA